MNNPSRLASRLREVILNGRWVANTNFQDLLSKVDVIQATTKFGDLNTIAALTFHVNYYIDGVLHVFCGGELEIRDKYSFDMPALESESDWQDLQQALYANTEAFASHVEQLTQEQLDETFVSENYGTLERNIEGLIEHGYYHLGQVRLLVKMLAVHKEEKDKHDV